MDVKLYASVFLISLEWENNLIAVKSNKLLGKN